MITKYINYLRNIKGYSENTCLAYEKDIRQFAKWMQAHRSDARWSNITREDIDDFITQLAERGIKAASSNRKLSAISGLYSFFKREGMETDNPCRFESRRKIAQTIPNTIKPEELQVAYNHSFGIAKVMIGILAGTGIRIQELLDLTWESIDFSENSLRIRGKGAKERLVYTTAESLDTLRQVKQHNDVSGLIFTIDQRQARYLIWEALKPYCDASQLSPHAIRHTFATNLAKEGVNVSTIGSILGHNQLTTTQKYIDSCQLQGREICQQYAILN